jgi:hypothetical protein
MDPNDLTPEERDDLARALRDPVTREALEWLGPLDLRSTLWVVRELERLHKRQQEERRLIRELSAALSRPGVLDGLRARRDDPLARDLLLIAYRLGLGDDPQPSR